MIYERFILIITCAVLSSSIARATELETVKFRSDDARPNKGKIYTKSETDNRHLVRLKPQYRLAQAQNDLERTEVLDSSINLEQPQDTGMSRAWSLGAMLATVLISLFLLWSLFRKPSSRQKREIATSGQNDLGSSKSVIRIMDIPAAENSASTEDSSKLSNPDRDSANRLNLAENELNLTIEELAKEIHLLELIKNLQQDNSRRTAVEELARVGHSRAIEPLVEIMSGAEVDRSLIIKAIAKIINRSFRSIDRELFTSLQHEDPEIRKSSIRDLTTLYEFASPIIEQLALMQLDANLEVQQTAKQAIKKLNLSSFDLATNYAKNGNKNSVFNIFEVNPDDRS